MIHPTALISPAAKFGRNVSVGAYTIINENVEIGDDTVIESHCEIGHKSSPADGNPLVIGKCALIRSHSVFYEGSSFGDYLVTGHRVTVRETTVAGRNLQIGTLCDIQGHCTIGDFVRLHSNVHIGQHSAIGSFVWIFPFVVLTNDPHPPSDVRQGVVVRDYAAIATMAVILPGVEIGEGALIGANSLVGCNVDANVVVAGSPARLVCKADQLTLKDGSGRPAYPWRRHFTRGYPEEYVRRWLEEFENGV